MNETLPNTLNAPSEQGRARSPVVQRSFVVENIHGLHARPAKLLIKCVAQFRCQVTVECGTESTDAHSLLGLLSLAAGWQSKLTFTARGIDATEAINAIEKLFTSHSEEACSTPTTPPSDETSCKHT